MMRKSSSDMFVIFHTMVEDQLPFAAAYNSNIFYVKLPPFGVVAGGLF
jgi:hypothetical protein